jgi:hypothetical protein
MTMVIFIIIIIIIIINDGTMCPGVDSASKNEYQENSWELSRPVRKGDDLPPPSAERQENPGP